MLTKTLKAYFVFWTNDEIEIVKNTVSELNLVHQFLLSFNNYDEPDWPSVKKP